MSAYWTSHYDTFLVSFETVDEQGHSEYDYPLANGATFDWGDSLLLKVFRYDERENRYSLILTKMLSNFEACELLNDLDPDGLWQFDFPK